MVSYEVNFCLLCPSIYESLRVDYSFTFSNCTLDDVDLQALQDCIGITVREAGYGEVERLDLTYPHSNSQTSGTLFQSAKYKVWNFSSTSQELSWSLA